MTYLPESYLHETEFPHGLSKDLAMQIRMIDEKYARFYPRIQYFCFRGDAAPAANDGNLPVQVVAQPNGSAFDPLWGETVDPAQAVDGVWKQPHSDGARVAADPERFHAPVTIHARVQRVAKEKSLKKWGFDKVRDILLFIPAATCDKFGITVREGDEFEWDGDRYHVVEEDSDGYWKNTNLRLYRVLNCEHKHSGA